MALARVSNRHSKAGLPELSWCRSELLDDVCGGKVSSVLIPMMLSAVSALRKRPANSNIGMLGTARSYVTNLVR